MEHAGEALLESSGRPRRTFGVASRWPLSKTEEPLLLGDGAVSRGDALVMVGDELVMVGDTPVSLGDELVSLGDDTRLLGDGARLLSDGARLLGDGARLPGDGARLVEGAVSRDPVAQRAVPGVPSASLMPTKRDVLAQLTRDELLAAADRFALPVPDRRAREGLVEVVASSKKAPLAEILSAYPRARLKELCRALGLDDGGKEKAPIVERLLGAPADEPEPRPSPARASATVPEQIEMPLGDKLTIDALDRRKSQPKCFYVPSHGSSAPEGMST